MMWQGFVGGLITSSGPSIEGILVALEANSLTFGQPMTFGSTVAFNDTATFNSAPDFAANPTYSVARAKNITDSTYSVPLTEDGFTYANTGASVDPRIDLPASAPLGFMATIAGNNGGQNIKFKAPTGEVIRVGGSTSSAGGTVATGALGAAITVRKVSNTGGPSNEPVWFTVAAAGTVGTIT